MKTTLRLASSLVALSALFAALPAASAAPLSVERIIAADQANDDVVLASSDGDELRKQRAAQENGADDNGSDDNGGDSDGEGDSEGSEGSEGGDHD